MKIASASHFINISYTRPSMLQCFQMPILNVSLMYFFSVKFCFCRYFFPSLYRWFSVIVICVAQWFWRGKLLLIIRLRFVFCTEWENFCNELNQTINNNNNNRQLNTEFPTMAKHSTWLRSLNRLMELKSFN